MVFAGLPALAAELPVPRPVAGALVAHRLAQRGGREACAAAAEVPPGGAWSYSQLNSSLALGFTFQIGANSYHLMAI